MPIQYLRNQLITLTKENKIMLFETYTLPANWASYLVNGDFSGLTEDEIVEVDDFVDREEIRFVTDVGESYFSSSNDFDSIGRDVADFICCVGSPAAMSD